MASLKKVPIYLTSWVAISTTALFSPVFASDSTVSSIKNRNVQAQGLPLLAQADVPVDPPMLEVEAPSEELDIEDALLPEVDSDEPLDEVVQEVEEPEAETNEIKEKAAELEESSEDVVEEEASLEEDVLDVEEEDMLLDEIGSDDSDEGIEDLLEVEESEDSAEATLENEDELLEESEEADTDTGEAEAVVEESSNQESSASALDIENTYSKLYQSLRAFIAEEPKEVVSQEAVEPESEVEAAQVEEVVQTPEEVQTESAAEEDLLAVLAEETKEDSVSEVVLEEEGDVLDVLEDIAEEVVVAEEEPQDLLEEIASAGTPAEEVESVVEESVEDVLANVEEVAFDEEEVVVEEPVVAEVAEVLDVVEESVEEAESVVPVAVSEAVEEEMEVSPVVPVTPVVEMNKPVEELAPAPSSTIEVVEEVVTAPVESAKIDSIVDQVADSASDVIKKVAQSAQDSLSKSVQPAQRYNIDRTRELFQGSVSESSGETTEGETVVEESPENIRDKVEITVSHRKKSEKPVNVEQKIAMAYKAMVSGQTEAAINVYKQVLEVQHRNKTALFGLATAYHRNNQLQQARSIYLEILQLYPKHQEAMNNFMLLVAKEDPNKALNELKKIERVNPNYSPVLAQIGMVYLQMENLKQAKSYLARAVGLTPGNASYLYNYAVILDSSGEEKQAVIFYQRLLKEVDRGAVIAGSVEKVVRRLEFLKRKLNHGS